MLNLMLFHEVKHLVRQTAGHYPIRSPPEDHRPRKDGLAFQ